MLASWLPSGGSRVLSNYGTCVTSHTTTYRQNDYYHAVRGYQACIYQEPVLNSQQALMLLGRGWYLHFTKEETRVQRNGRAGSGMREPGDWYKTVSQKEAKREARKF